jgi:hypothetical protein
MALAGYGLPGTLWLVAPGQLQNEDLQNRDCIRDNRPDIAANLSGSTEGSEAEDLLVKLLQISTPLLPGWGVMWCNAQVPVYQCHYVRAVHQVGQEY